MKPIKSISVFLMIFCMAFSIFCAGSASAYTLSLQATSDGSTAATEFVPGADLYLNIVVDNAGGIAGCAFTLNYPADVLTPPTTDVEGVSSDITSIFPFTFNDGTTTPDTFRGNAATPAKIYLAGAAIDTTDGGAKYDSGEDVVLFTVKFTVKSDASLGSFDLSLTQTVLDNADAGYVAPNNTVPVLVGAVDNGHVNWEDLSLAFPILLGDATHPFTTVTKSDCEVVAAPTYSISGTIAYTGPQTGTIYVGAFDDPDTGTANMISSATIAQPGAYNIENLPNGTYYIGSYRDSDEDMVVDPAEAQGMYLDSANPTAVTIFGADITGKSFTIFDPVNSGTGEPLYYENWKTTNGWTDIGATNSDYDQDGYSNIQEFINETDPTSQNAPDGTGYDLATDNRVAPWTPITGNQYTMIVTGTAFADDVNVAIGDWIGGFGPGGDSDCRATQQVSIAGEYYLTVRGNDSSGETINFKLRRSSDMKILTSTDTVEFVSDDVITEKVLNFSLSRTQTINFIEGWNWVSFNVIPDDISLPTFFGANLNNIEQVKTQTNSMLNIGGNWIGDDPNIMSKIDQYQMFKIKVAVGLGFTLNVNGQPLDPQASIDLQMGWSWIAYLPDYCLDVQTAIATVFDNINQVKSQSASKLKIDETTFIGDMNEMCPGNGYTIKMLDNDTLQYPQQP